MTSVRAYQRRDRSSQQSGAEPTREFHRPNLLERLLYRLYELRLLHQLRERPLPCHVGIILDGNRRFARRQRVTEPVEMYSFGARKLDEVLGWCCELKISAVTLWALSIENLQRSPQEVAGILNAIEVKLTSLARDPKIHQRRVRLRVVGRLELLPESTVAAIRAAEVATATYDSLTLTIAIAYGGRLEISDAVCALIRESAKRGLPLEEIVDDITPEAISRHLYTADLPDPDLIIRTSGETRLSGFLLWQSAYSEFYFSDVNWPALRKVDFLRAVRAYQQRDRRFGR